MSATAQEVDQTEAVHDRVSSLPAWRRALVFGTGLGIAIADRNLDVAIARSRPGSALLTASTVIADFRSRPTADWGAELGRFLEAAGEKRLAATVLLPRREIIVRSLVLPGVSDKDAPGAIELQLDSLHPWGDAEVAWSWSRVGRDDLLVGLTRKDVLDSWETLFAEAGVAIAAVTFSAAAIHSALRMWSAAPASVFCFITGETGRTEIYGESPARPVFSADFSIAAERALALSRAELRLAGDHYAHSVSAVLPAPATGATVPSAPAWAAALAGSAPRSVRFPNLLPPERRASHDRLQYFIPAVLASLVALALLAVFVLFPALEQRRYRTELDRAARQLEPAALRAQNLDRSIRAGQANIAALDDLRRRPQADLDVLNELTRILPPAVWTSAIEIYPDSVIITGEADQAATLLKLVDSSPLFQNSEFALSVTHSGQTEQFRIRTMRRGRAGRTTP